MSILTIPGRLTGPGGFDLLSFFEGDSTSRGTITTFAVLWLG